MPPTPKATHTTTIISSSKINKKVTWTLSTLFPSIYPNPNQPNSKITIDNETEAVVISLTAKANVSSKLVSVVEIVKREVARSLECKPLIEGDGSKGGKSREGGRREPGVEDVKLFQYTTVHALPREQRASGVPAPAKGVLANGKKRQRRNSASLPHLVELADATAESPPGAEPTTLKTTAQHEESDDEYFTTLQSHADSVIRDLDSVGKAGTETERDSSVMTIWLSRRRIGGLEQEGEQIVK